MDAQRAVAWRSGGPNVASSQNGSRGKGVTKTNALESLVIASYVANASARDRASAKASPPGTA